MLMHQDIQDAEIISETIRPELEVAQNVPVKRELKDMSDDELTDKQLRERYSVGKAIWQYFKRYSTRGKTMMDFLLVRRQAKDNEAKIIKAEQVKKLAQQARCKAIMVNSMEIVGA